MDNQHHEYNVNRWDQYTLNGEELPIYQIFQLLTVTENSQSAIEGTRDFCLQAKSEENKRVGLEFLYSYGFLKELDQLIAINLRTDNSTNRNWAKVYQVMNVRRKTKKVPNDYFTPYKYIDKITDIDTQDIELQCLSDLLHIFCYFDLKQYNKIGEYSDRVLLAIHQIKDPLVKELLSIRLDEALVIFHWKRNEMIMARKFGYRILNTTHNPRKKIDIHNMMALGYLFDSYEQAIHHAYQAREIAYELEFLPAMEGLNNFTIPFISAYHGKTEGISSTDKAEMAHIALAKADYQTCIKILSEFESLTPFQQYYLGKALQDEDLLQKSYQRFIHERSDYFYARLPLNELRKIRVMQ